MASERYTREYGQHLVEQVTEGEDVAPAAAGTGFGVRPLRDDHRVLLSACGGEESGSSTSASPWRRRRRRPKSGGTLTVTALAPLSALDPVTMYQTGDIATVEQICEYLIWVENDFTLRPVLAESWTPDDTAQVWTFKLRQGVTFNDGSPFGAEDVVTTFDRLVDPEERLGGPVGAQGHPVAGGHPEGRRSHGRLQPGQALRRLPVPGLVGQLQLGDPAAHLRRRLRQERGGHRPVHAGRLQAQAQRLAEEEPHLLAERPSVPRRRRVQVQRRRPGADPAAAVRRGGRPGADGVPGLAGAHPGPQPQCDRHTLHRPPRGGHARGPRPVQRQERTAGGRVLPRPAGHHAGHVRRPGDGRQRSDLLAALPRLAHVPRAHAGLREGQAAARRRRLRERRAAHHHHGRELPRPGAVRHPHPGAVQAGRHRHQAQHHRGGPVLRRRRRDHPVAAGRHDHRGVVAPPGGRAVHPGDAHGRLGVELLALGQRASSTTSSGSSRPRWTRPAAPTSRPRWAPSSRTIRRCCSRSGWTACGPPTSACTTFRASRPTSISPGRGSTEPVG